MTQPPLPPGHLPPAHATAPQVPADAGFLHVHLQGSMLTSNAITPRIFLNGHRMLSQYGENVFPVPPGPWRVACDAQWLRTYGQATLDVHVAPGQHLAIWYAAPFHQFARGNMGLEKQARPGKAALVVALLMIALVVLGVVALGVSA